MSQSQTARLRQTDLPTSFLAECVVRDQQEGELSTAVLQVRKRLLILTVIGAIDSPRAEDLTEQILMGIRANRSKLVLVDVTGVPAIDSRVGNLWVFTIEVARLMGVTVIICGLSARVSQTLAQIGVDLSKITIMGDLQEGLEEAKRLLSHKVVRIGNKPSSG
ncbi:MAG: hypothetical protein DMG12_13850 [Acidobacteria bacterium]|nr:MAG: hypothetical protein DMG12_13850 [Acidobacteriota bacterium]